MTSEQWKPVVGFEGFYEVSDLGRLRSVPKCDSKGRHIRGKILKHPARFGGRYIRTLFRVHKVRSYRTLHHLVLEAFVGPRPIGMHGCHNDGDTNNNALSNLRWDSARNNQRDKIQHGTIARGERNGWAKLTEQDILLARQLYASGVGPTAVAERLGISRKHAQEIKRKDVWGWL